MVRLTFLGGVGEIGGNKILLETAGTRVCLDFGKPFKIDDRYFTTYLRPRGLADYLRLNLVDPVPGLYSKSALEDSGIPYTDKSAIDAVIISHVHYDHVAHLRYLHPKIQVFIGEATLRMLHAWETTSPQNKFGAHPYTTFKTGSTVEAHCVWAEAGMQFRIWKWFRFSCKADIEVRGVSRNNACWRL